MHKSKVEKHDINYQFKLPDIGQAQSIDKGYQQYCYQNNVTYFFDKFYFFIVSQKQQSALALNRLIINLENPLLHQNPAYLTCIPSVLKRELGNLKKLEPLHTESHEIPSTADKTSLYIPTSPKSLFLLH